jgi:hypothetical protein
MDKLQKSEVQNGDMNKDKFQVCLDMLLQKGKIEV